MNAATLVRRPGFRPSMLCRRTLLYIRRYFLHVALGLLLGGPFIATHAQTDSSSPIHIVVPFVPGGPSDLMARKISEELGKRIHRPVIIDNRAGGGGSIAAEYVARSKPDGTTILWATSTIAIDPVLRPWLPYKVQKAFTPIVTALDCPLTVIINARLPVHSIADLVNYAKKNPGKLNFGSGGIGTSLHLVTEEFMLDAGIKMIHVPYKGANEAMVGIISNNIQVLFNPIPTALQFKQNNAVRVLAVTTKARSQAWPELPTVAQSGVHGLNDFDADMWYGFYAPANTPTDVVNYLNKEIVLALKEPEMQKWLLSQGMQALGDTPAQARQRLDNDVREWGKVVPAAHIKISN